MGLTAFAGEASPYADLKNTTTVITFDEKDCYLIDYDSTTVTLLSKECVAASSFGSNTTYSGSTVEAAVKTNKKGTHMRTFFIWLPLPGSNQRQLG